MAVSITTKQVIGNAFRSLMTDFPFSKISVGDICEKCDINRKSFYYHYKDKYDLANSIFDSDFPFLTDNEGLSVSDTVKSLCRYLYENRSYYRKLFETEGQNSFSEHLCGRLYSFIRPEIKECDDFQAHFWADALLCALRDWILDRNAIHYDDFYRRLRSCMIAKSFLS